MRFRRISTLPPPGLWTDQAACKGRTEEFFGLGPVPRALVTLCAGCPVHDDCLDYALKYNPFGIWAGTSWEQRNVMLGRKGRSWPGTNA